MVLCNIDLEVCLKIQCLVEVQFASFRSHRLMQICGFVVVVVEVDNHNDCSALYIILHASLAYVTSGRFFYFMGGGVGGF